VDKIDLSAVTPSYISILHAQGASYLFPSTPGGQMQIAAAGDVEANDILTGGATNYYIVGDDNGLTLIGGDNADTIVGGRGNDTIAGGKGGDALYSGKDDGRLGDGGKNTFVYFSAADSNNQNLDIIHGFYIAHDKLDLTALNPSNVSIIYYNGGTFISGSAADGAFQIASVEQIRGTDIVGLTGGLYVVGDDTRTYYSLDGSANADTIIGSSKGEYIVGGGSGDALFGGGGADIFRFEGGADSNGGAGMLDILHDFQTGVDSIALGTDASNVSIIRYNGGSFIFGASPNGGFQIASTKDVNAADLIWLASGAYMVGDDNSQTLIGGDLAETIQGGASADVIIGGGNADALFGGGGADVFKYLKAFDSAPGGSDIIHDFQTGVDKIDLTALHTSANDKYSLVSDASASYLFVQLAGNTANDMQILFATPNVHASDILW